MKKAIFGLVCALYLSGCSPEMQKELDRFLERHIDQDKQNYATQAESIQDEVPEDSASKSAIKIASKSMEPCIKQYLIDKGSSHGRIALSITISEDGTVSQVNVIENQFDDSLLLCFKDKVMSQNFGVMNEEMTFKKVWVL